MFSIVGKKVFNTTSCNFLSKAFYAHMSKDEIMWHWPAQKFDQHFIDYLNKPDIDGWEIRKALTELGNFDVVPDPKVVEAALRAIRRVNDFALAIRFLEQIKYKCGGPKSRSIVYPYIIQEVKPVMDELGIPTLEEIGYDEPEFFTPDPEWYWEKSWYKLYGFDKLPGYKHLA
ncbi:hypothetical protein niasHS_006632 [Heterodera schachtii]|uniref:Cytochrome c oxidase subunit 5A, mitochondrial n=1 Tax=Heterodera schachtii TaxID=97005 RepID=A0ABD2JHT0_HETSC